MTPMLATLIDEPFDAEGWIFEIKWDGYRAIATKEKRVHLVSRNDLSFNDRFPTIVEELEKISGKFVLDGEVVLFDKKGRSDFQLVQNYSKKRIGTPYYYVFDILSLDGENLTQLPLLQRKAILKKLIRGSKHVKFSGHVEEKGKAFFRAAAKKGLEGIVAKKADSVYQFRRTRDWLKIKYKRRQEVVIGGFTEPKGSRKLFGALLVGVYEKGKLIFVGNVGGGFNQERLRETYAELKKHITSDCPFATAPKLKSVTWVKPKLVCEVEFAEWTQGGSMRVPIFKGMRVDKDPKKVVRE
jgi:bifunctional non-homologous end joining protein LigD